LNEKSFQQQANAFAKNGPQQRIASQFASNELIRELIRATGSLCTLRARISEKLSQRPNSHGPTLTAYVSADTPPQLRASRAQCARVLPEKRREARASEQSRSGRVRGRAATPRARESRDARQKWKTGP